MNSQESKGPEITLTNYIPMINNQYQIKVIPLNFDYEETRPLWSVMIPTYNCAQYLCKTLESVLSQDLSEELMQIEVIDDHSTKDNPEEVVKEIGKGRVKFYRQPKNVGQLENFRTCLERAKGKLVHLLHGDDYVLYGFYKKIEQAFASNSHIGAAFCRHIFMDDMGNWKSISPLLQTESGVISNWLETIITGQYVQTPSIVVKRDVYEMLGGFDKRLSFCEDWEMWVRIATSYPVWYEVEPLAVYRIHTESTSGRVIRTGQNVQDFLRGHKLVQSYLSSFLPEPIVKDLIRKNRERIAIGALNYAQNAFFSGEFKTCKIQVHQAFSASQSPRVLAHFGKLLATSAIRKLYFSNEKI